LRGPVRMSEAPSHRSAGPARSVSAVVLPSWAKAAARCGFDLEPVLRAEGIELDLMQLEHARISLRQLDRVLERCIERTPDTHFPFVVGETFAFEYLPDMETFLTTSSTLRDAARVLEWIPELVNPLIDARMVETGASARIVLDLPPSVRSGEKPYHAEMFFASIIKFVRALAGQRAGLQRLDFTHSAPAYADRYTPFYGLPVAFGQRENALHCDRDSLDRKLDSDAPGLHQQAAALVEQRIARLHSRPLAERVESLLGRNLSLLGQGIEDAAKALNLGTRTLQRQLADEGTTFALIVDRVRYAQARRMLADGHRTDRISDSLGFSDRRSFTRAFKRWSGRTPKAYRDGIAGSGPA